MKLINQYKGLRKEIYILFIGRIVTRFGSMVWSMLTLLLNQKLGYSAAEISVLLLIFSAVSMVATLTGGKMADHLNKKYIIIGFDCLSIALYFVCAFIPLSTLTVAFIVLAAAGQWAEHPAYDALVADMTLSEDRERAYALQYLGTNIGLMVAPTLAGFLFKEHLSLLFIICAVAISVSTVLIALKVKDIKPVVEEDKVLQQRRDGESIWKVLKDNKIFFLYFAAFGLYAAGYSQYNYLMPLDLGRIYGEEGAVLFGTVSSTNCFIVVIFSSIILSLFTKVKPTKKILIAELLLMAGFAVFLIFINFIPAYYIAIALFTFGEIFAMMGASPFLTAHAPASHRGRITSISSVVETVMSSLILLAVGGFYDGSGYVSAWIFVIGILFLAVILTVIMNVVEKRGEGNSN